MDIKMCSLSSGSNGNCVFISSGITRILVDAGISVKKIIEGLTEIGETIENIDAVLVTHEHIDHIKSIGPLARKYGISIYGTRGTLQECLNGRNKIGEVNPILLNSVKPDNTFVVGDILITPFRVSHDACDPVAYTFKCGEKKLGMATDLGFFDKDIINHLSGSVFLYLESNHDTNMLEVGPYPYPLKQRIKSDLGHLSNEDCAKLLVHLCNDYDTKIEHVILAHLSEENNFPELAYETVMSEIVMEVESERRPEIHVAPRFTASYMACLGSNDY